LIVQSLPYILLLGTIFGTTLIASRFGISQFDPIAYIALRFLLASLGYIFIYSFSINGRKWPKDRQVWKHASLLGIFGTVMPMTFLIYSLQLQSSGLTAILITTAPAITLLMAHFFLDDEKLTRAKVAGVMLALIGAVLLSVLGESGLPDVSRANPVGYILVITAMLFGSGMIIYARKYMSGLSSFDVGAVRNLSAGIAILPVFLFITGVDFSRVELSGYLALGWAAVAGTFVAMLLEFYIIKRFGATSAVMTAYVIPVVAGIGGVLLLDETFTRGMLLGMALIILGIAIINRGSTKREIPSIEPV